MLYELASDIDTIRQISRRVTETWLSQTWNRLIVHLKAYQESTESALTRAELSRLITTFVRRDFTRMKSNECEDLRLVFKFADVDCTPEHITSKLMLGNSTQLDLMEKAGELAPDTLPAERLVSLISDSFPGLLFCNLFPMLRNRPNHATPLYTDCGVYKGWYYVVSLYGVYHAFCYLSFRELPSAIFDDENNEILERSAVFIDNE